MIYRSRSSAAAVPVAVAALFGWWMALWPAHGQAPYPSQGIRLVVPYAAGGMRLGQVIGGFNDEN